MNQALFLVLLVFYVHELATCSVIGGNASGVYYVFAYSWQPEFCYGYTTAYPGCTAEYLAANPTHKAFWESNFTLHGLWPQYADGGYPHDCTTEAFDVSIPKTVGMEDMLLYWPNVKYAESDPMYTEFWEHEWTKHGTCSGLSQLNYFQSTINLIKKIGTPKSLTTASGNTISAATLRQDLGGSKYVSLECSSTKYLTGAFLCVSQVNGFPGELIPCAADVQAEDTCTAAILSVQSF